jgi:two-component system phosphate regulon sensor histidine kinase PhoR
VTNDLAYRAALGAAVVAIVAFAAGGASAGSGSGPVFVALVAAAGAGAFGFLLFRPIRRAIRQVGAAAARITAGELGGGVPPATGPASELTSSFNLMSRTLEQLFREIDAEHARRDALLNASTDGVLALARDTSVRLANTAAASILGTSVASMLDRPLIESARDYELDAIARRVAATRTPDSAVITYGPSRLPLRAAAVPIEGGGEWAVLLLLTDLSDLTRIDQVRRDFVTNVSHELRTPLASIRALAETIESGDVEPGRETSEFARRICQQVDRLALLVNELLELSRIESGAIELRPAPVDVAAVARQAASLLQAKSDSAGVSVLVPDDGPILEADPDALLRILTNLLDNAIKFSPRGATVTVEARDEEGAVAIAVRDQGPGIAAADLPRVFERFFKGDSSRSGVGVGLGLAIVKHLVRSHGGAVEARSEEGAGATFVVRLPRRFAGPRAPRDR